jgi:hypothetical protein
LNGVPAASILSDFSGGPAAAFSDESLDDAVADAVDDGEMGPFGTAYAGSVERAEAQAQAQLEKQAQAIEQYLVSFREALSDNEDEARICDQLTAAIRDMKEAVAKRKSAVARAVPAASFLLDFGNAPIAAFGDEKSRGAVTPKAMKAVNAEIVDERQLEVAYARGVEEGKAAAQAHLEARLEEQKLAFENSLASLRETWRGEEGARLAYQLTTAIGDMKDSIAKTVEHLIKPFLSKAICTQAITELRSTLEQLVASSPGISLEISGPEGLLGGIRASMPGSIAAVSYIANEACDVQVKAGESLLETRISAWLKQIEWGPK